MPTDLAMDWRWVALGLTVPTLVGMLVAFPVWPMGIESNHWRHSRRFSNLHRDGRLDWQGVH